jgi:murein DD-endopeptidase MepM/ murein hydrolase activator NlpD
MKPSTFRSRTSRDAALRGGIARRCHSALDRWFPPRELILRTDGRVAYLAISSRQQKFTAAFLLGFLVWGGYATTSMILSGRALVAERGQLDRAQVAYADLMNQVAGSYDQLVGYANNLRKGQEVAALGGRQILDQGHGNALHGSSRVVTAEQNQQQQASLRDKLQLFEADLDTVAAHNTALYATVGKLRNELQTAEIENTNTVNKLRGALQTAEVANNNLELAHQETTAELQDTRHQLASELESMDRVLAIADGQKHSLAQQVASLQSDLQSTEMRDAQVDLARQTAEEQIGLLLGQLNSARDDNSRLLRQISDTQMALNTAMSQRDALQSARRDLTGRIGDLENQLASIQLSQQTIVERLAARTRNGVDEVEKTVAMTGVDVDALLLRAAHELSGQGGPFIPVKEPPPEAGGEQLMASVASLDGEVGRLETLQLVLRTMPLTAPVDHYFVASNFGIRRDPFNGRLAFHSGLDLANALLSPVLSTSPGVVVYAGWMGGYGRIIEIDHGLGIHTRYGHLARIDVKVGDTVDYRQQIGLLGSSGRSSGPHVHYEVLVNGRPLDPMNFLKAGRYVFKG